MTDRTSPSAQRADWLYQPAFPAHWKRRALYSLARWVNGVAFRDIQFSPTGKPVIKIAEIKQGLTDQTRYTEQVFDESVHVKKGDLLFTWSGQPETSIDVFWWRGPDGWLNQHSFRVTPNEGIDPVFFYYLLKYLSPNFIEIAHNKQTTGLGHVTKQDLESMEVAYPQLSEQRAIAHILGTLDDKIELNRRMNETLEAIAQALFKSWFIDFDPVHAKAEGRDTGLPPEVAALFPESFEDSELGQIPRGWEVGVLNDLVEAILGGDWGQDEATAEAVMPVRCIRGADIPDLQKGGTGKMPVRFVKPASLRRRQLSDGDIVVEISGGSPTQSTGRPVFVSGRLLGRLGMPVVCSNFCRSIKFRSPMFSRFAYFWLRSLYESDEFLQFENGTTGIKNLAFTRFSSDYKLCIPPLQVLRAFDQQVSCVFDKQQTNAAESDTLSAVRDGLLPRLLSGAVKTDSYVADA